MKKHLLALPILVLTVLFTVYSCKKEKIGCDGGNLCFTVNGKDVVGTAVRKSLPNNRYRLYWQDTLSSTTQTVEIDIYGNTVAEYNITDNPGTAGDVGFQYYENDGTGQVYYHGTSGKLDLSSVDTDKWTGTFEGTVTNGTASFPLKNGKFFQVPLE